MEDAPTINEPPRYLKIVIWLVSIIIAGFYIVSAFGWFAATYMMSVGVLGKEAADFYNSLNIAEKLIRASQVFLIVATSITLLLKRRITLKLVLISISISLISFLFFEKWSISFLGGIPGLLYLTIVYAYAYWLNRRGVLR
jgi:hypothetical protein